MSKLENNINEIESKLITELKMKSDKFESYQQNQTSIKT
jgi:hypothetical protein